jgi:hypothetical protein
VVVLVRATRRLRRRRGVGGDTPTSPDQELRRARTIIFLGLAVWLAIALAVELRYGTIATVVLVGWGGSGVLCFVFGVWPLGLAQRRSFAVEIIEDEDAAPAPPVVRRHAVEPITDIVDLRDGPLDPGVGEELRLALDSTGEK